MRYIYRRGYGARRRVMHLCGYDEKTGEPTLRPLCRINARFDTSCNLPLGQAVCKPCMKKAGWLR